MRNLKRALSLTLASVMLLGMMVMGSSAASYPDVDDSDNIEAIEVLQAVQVMRGDDNGNFDPDRSVTRAEMAVVMALLLDLDYQYYEASCPFTDVPAWARPYVGACYANKIVSGYSAATYGANDSVTAVQAASMMMRALGYFQYDSDYADGFETATVRQGTRIGIFDGVGSSATAAMTRNQVAQMALNALESAMVEADDDTLNITTTTGNATTTVTGGKVNYVVIASDKAFARAISTVEASSTGLNGVSGTIVELGEQLYNGDLRKSSANDGFGAPATRWTYKNAEVGTYTDEADYVLEGTVKSSDMYAAVGKTAAEDYQWTVRLDGSSTNRGEALFTQKDVEDNNSDDLAGTGRGTTTYVYLNNTAHNGYAGTATVCIVNTYAAEVTKVADGKITLNDVDGKRLDFETTGYSEDDIVLYTKYVNGSSWTVDSVIGEAELVEGEAETVRAGKYVVVGGTTYNYSAKFNDLNGGELSADSADAEVALYLDRQGNIIYIGDAKENTNYAFVLGVGKASSKYTDEADFGAQLVCSDGTILNVDLDSDYTNGLLDDAAGTPAGQDNGATSAVDADLATVSAALLGKAVTFNKESDGTYTLETGNDSNSYQQVSWEAEGDGDGDDGDDGDDGAAAPSRSDATVLESYGDIIKNGRSRIDLSKAAQDGDDDDDDDSDDTVPYIYTDNNTIFVLNSKDDSRTKFSVYTGYSEVPDVQVTDQTILAAYVNNKGIVKAVFVTNAEIAGVNDVVFVVGANDVRLNGTGSNRYYVYDAVVDGEATTIQVRNGSAAATEVAKLKKGSVGIFFGMTTSDGYVTGLKTSVPTGVQVNRATSEWTAYSGTQRLTDGVYGFGYVAEGRAYRYHIAPNNDAVIAYLDGDDLTIESRVETDINDKAWVVTDDGELSAIFVMKVADDADDEEELPELNIEEVDGVIVITSIETLNNNQIVQAIAEYLNVSEDDVAYNSRTKEATVGRTTYGVSFTKVGTKEEVAGAELAAAVENAVPNPFGTVEVKGNEIIVTGGDTYGNAVPGHTATEATDDLARFLAALHDEDVETITFNQEEYTWDPERTTRSKWVKAAAEEAQDGDGESEVASVTLVKAIVDSISEDFASGSCTFTIYPDGKPVKFTIKTTWEPSQAGDSE